MATALASIMDWASVGLALVAAALWFKSAAIIIPPPPMARAFFTSASLGYSGIEDPTDRDMRRMAEEADRSLGAVTTALMVQSRWSARAANAAGLATLAQSVALLIRATS